MSKFHRARPALAAAMLAALVSGGAVAASDPSSIPVDQASAAYLQVLRGAVTTGWTEGQFTAWNDAGVQTETNNNAQCITPEQGNELPDSLAEMFAGFAKESNCKTTAYEPGTLRFAMSCAKEGKTFTFDSSGSFAPDTLDLSIKLKATGQDAPDLGSMHVIGKRTRDCTAQEISAANAEATAKKAD